MLVSKTFTVPVNPVQNPPSVITSDQPFFDPGTSTSGLSFGVTVGGASSSLVQATGEAAVMGEAGNKSATHPVEGPSTDVKQQNATQPVEAPGARTATQSVEAPGAGPDVLPTGTGSAALHAEFSGSDREEELQSDPGAVFTKGLSQVLGLSWLYFYTKVKPKTWLRPFVNTAPGLPVDGNVQEGSPLQERSS